MRMMPACAIVAGVLLHFPVFGSVPLTQAKPDGKIDAKTRVQVIDSLVSQLNRVYVNPDLAKAMERDLRARQSSKEYESISDGKQFAELLTKHLRAVCKDGHLSVDFFPKGIPYDSEAKPDPKQIADFEERGRRRNYAYRKVEQLDGGVGLLQVDGFFPGEMAASTIESAMKFLENSESIILDLRTNHGGAPTGCIQLVSYFLPEETELSTHINRMEGTTHPWWTHAVAGPRFVDKPLYILTSKETFSAPESVAYDLQALKRATIVGEETGGGAHGTTIFRLTDAFSASIPCTLSINPITKTDWEGTGVKPDVPVAAGQALLTAHILGLKQALSNATADPERAAQLKGLIAAKEKELAAMAAH